MHSTSNGKGDSHCYGFGNSNGSGIGGGNGGGNGYGDGDGSGYSDGDSDGGGYSNGNGDGSGDGDGYCDGDGNSYGYGYGDGNSSGNGYSYGRHIYVCECACSRVYVSLGHLVKAGCEVMPLSMWRDQWRQVADKKDVNVTEAQANKIFELIETKLKEIENDD